MNYVYLRVFIENYSLPTLIISSIVSVLNLLYDKFCADKLPATVRNFLPFLLSTILYYTYDMIFVLHGFTFSAGTFSAGVLSGSLSVIITASVYKLKNGKPISANAEILLIENLLSNYVKADLISYTASTIKSILDGENEDKEQQIFDTVLKNSDTEINSVELKVMVALIIKAVMAVKTK
ncbi:MAG: hypothetical protein IJX16_06310 [Clostridia bacterium]|nr:hypothetical protein [Clostridia bacterium]